MYQLHCCHVLFMFPLSPSLPVQYVREVFRLLGDDLAYQELGDDIMDYAQQWMRFVIDKCDRGRGTRLRYVY